MYFLWVHLYGKVFKSLEEQKGAEIASAADKPLIMENVAIIVADINNGKSAKDIKPDVFLPFISIMDPEGELIVHPQWPGFNVRNTVPFIYNEIIKGTVDWGMG